LSSDDRPGEKAMTWSAALRLLIAAGSGMPTVFGMAGAGARTGL
jgi:hypothetical protein